MAVIMKPLGADESDAAATVVRKVLPPDTAQGMRTVLQQVVVAGIETAASSLYTTAGKTATMYMPNAVKCVFGWRASNREFRRILARKPAAHRRLRRHHRSAECARS